MKKKLALITAWLFIANMFWQTLAINVHYPDEWMEAVNFMKENWLSSTANSVSEYEPLATVKRESASKFLYNYAKNLFNKDYVKSVKDCKFNDLYDAQRWAVVYIIKSCRLWLLKWENWNFLPKQEFTKAQLLTVLARIYKNDPSLSIQDAFDVMKEYWITKENNLSDTFRPITRIELALLFKRAYNKYKEIENELAIDSYNEMLKKDYEDLLRQFIQEQEEQQDEQLVNQEEQEEQQEEQDEQDEQEQIDQEEQTDEQDEQTDEQEEQEQIEQEEQTDEQEEQLQDKLYVFVNKQWDEQTIPWVVSHLRTLELILKAWTWEVNIDNIEIKIDWLINRNEIKNVYVEDEEYNILSKKKKLNTNNRALLKMNEFTIPANTERKVYVAIDLETQEQKEFNIKVVNIQTDKEIEWDLPIVSDTFNTINYELWTISFEWLKDINETSYIPIYIWETDKVIYKFTLKNISDNERNAILKKIKLRNIDWNLDEIIDNVKLYEWNTQIPLKDVKITWKYLILTIDDYEYPVWSSKMFTIKADIVWWEKNDKLELYLDDSSDLIAIDWRHDFVLKTEIENWKIYYRWFKIEWWDVVIKQWDNNPTASYIPSNEDNIKILEAELITSTDIYIDKIRVFKDDASIATWNDIKQVSLYINDQFVESVNNETIDWWNAMYVFNFDWELKKWENKIEVFIDTTEYAQDWKTIRIEIKPDSFAFWNNAEYIETEETLEWDDINWYVRSNLFVIKKPWIEAIIRTDWITNWEKIIIWEQNKLIARYLIQNNNVRDLRLTDLNFEIEINWTWWSTINDISNIAIRENNDIIKQVNVNWSDVIINWLNVNIPKWQTKELDVLIFLNNTIKTWDKIRIILKKEETRIEDNKWIAVNLDNVIWNWISSAWFEVSQWWKLILSYSYNTPNEWIITADPMEEKEVFRFKVKAIDEDIKLQELVLLNNKMYDPWYYYWSWFLDYLYTWADSIVNKVYLYNENGLKLWETQLIWWVAYFNLLNPYVIENNWQEEELIVKIKTNNITSVEQTNKYVYFHIYHSWDAIDWYKKTRFISTVNWEEIESIDFYWPHWHPQLIRKASFEVITSSDSREILNWENELYRFTIIPDWNVKLNEILLRFEKIWSWNINIDNMKLELNWVDKTDYFYLWFDNCNSWYIHIESNWSYYEITEETEFVLKWDINTDDWMTLRIWMEENYYPIDIAIKNNTRWKIDYWLVNITEILTWATVTWTYQTIWTWKIIVDWNTKINNLSFIVNLDNNWNSINEEITKLQLRIYDWPIYIWNFYKTVNINEGLGYNVVFNLNKVFIQWEYKYKLKVTNWTFSTGWNQVTVSYNYISTEWLKIPIIWSDWSADYTYRNSKDWFTSALIKWLNSTWRYTLTKE